MTSFLRRVGVGTTVAGVLVGVGLVPMMAWAEGTTTLTFNFEADQSEGRPQISLYAYDDNDRDNAIENGTTGNGIGVRIEGINDRFFGFDLEDGARNRIDTSRIGAVCASDTSCTITVSGVDTSLQSNGVHFIIPGDSGFDIYFVEGHRHYDMSTDNLLSDDNFIIEYRENNSAPFDGRAYAIWSCGEDNGEVCLHLIEGIGNQGDATEYYAASTITDITDASRTFNKFGDFEDEDYERGMALAVDVEEWVRDYTGNESAAVTDVDWSQVDIHQFLRGVNKGDWEAELISKGICDGNTDEETLHRCVDQYFDNNGLSETRGVKLQPVGETQGVNSYTSYGDRNFRLTIYDNDYKAIELGNLNDLYYVPAYYEDATFVDAIDISGTTEAKPAIMHSVLLESNVSIEAAATGGLNIASIRAIGVPAGAVNITKENDNYKIVFNSNFYDGVTFAITDTAGEVYYLKVERSILDTRLDRSGAVAEFFFDATTSYSDYELVATYAYSDGAMVQKIMKNSQWIDDGLGNITHDYETSGGINLKKATYITEEEGATWMDGLAGVYFNVRMAGSTDTKYNGTLAGSGLGIYEPSPWNREER